MELLTFELNGKMAHFRKYYANNTAFSFSIPPRTTLMGIVAAALGWSKDTYYEKLSSEHIRFGIRVLKPLKKSFHRVNFLRVTSTGNLAKNMSSHFRGEDGRIQTPFEIVMPLDLATSELAYQIFISPVDAKDETFREVKESLLTKHPKYNISLGTANFSASIKNVNYWDASMVEHKQTDSFVHLHSAIPTELVVKLEYETDQIALYNAIEEELMPGDFIKNHDREVKRMNRILFSASNAPLRVMLKTDYWSLKMNNETINFQFMDA